jgi:hypothetical protein
MHRKRLAEGRVARLRQAFLANRPAYPRTLSWWIFVHPIGGAQRSTIFKITLGELWSRLPCRRNERHGALAGFGSAAELYSRTVARYRRPEIPTASYTEPVTGILRDNLGLRGLPSPKEFLHGNTRSKPYFNLVVNISAHGSGDTVRGTVC